MKSLFHHEEIYRGKDFFNKIKNTHITICGVGALGSNLLDNLARQGYTKFRVIDMDRVEEHNIGSQIYNKSHVGSLKVQAAKNLIFQSTGIEIETEHKELNQGNVKKLLKGTNLVLDVFDNAKSRKIVTDYCMSTKRSCLHLGLAPNGYSEVIWNERYIVPNEPNKNEVAPCDQPIARNSILLTVISGSEIINNYIANGSQKDLYITLKDLKISWRN